MRSVLLYDIMIALSNRRTVGRVNRYQLNSNNFYLGVIFHARPWQSEFVTTICYFININPI